MAGNTTQPLKWDAVREEELREIKDSRANREETWQTTGNESRPLFGLALSGGGIRSATFSLGIIQHLRKIKLLPYFDYLSTVSGGCYIGSWMISALKNGVFHDDDRLEKSIHQLRRYGNYLAPRTGFLSADVWTSAMVWIRNTLLVQATVVALISSVLMIPRPLEWFFAWNGAGMEWLVGAAGWALLVVAVVLAGLALTRRASWPPIWLIVACTVVSVFLVSQWIWQTSTNDRGITQWALYAAALLVPNLILSVASLRKRSTGRVALALLVSVLASAFAIGLMAAAWSVLSDGYKTYSPENPAWAWHVLVWLTPVVLEAESLVIVLMIGLLGREMAEAKREWWSRIGAWLGIWSLAWLVVTGVTAYGPLLASRAIEYGGIWVRGGAFLSWVGATLAGLLAGRSAKTESGGKSEGTPMSLAANVAPYVFIAGLLLGVATLIEVVLARDLGAALAGQLFLDASVISNSHWLLLTGVPVLDVVAAIGVALVCLLVLGWRVDINEFSLNPYYRSRLVRCYLGSTRFPPEDERHPDNDTGFDPDDDIRLSKFSCGNMSDGQRYGGPLPIVNTSINMGKSSDLDLQERNAHSFTLTPLHCGFWLPGKTWESLPDKEKRTVGYRETPLYSDKTGTGGIHLGSALAISGAAASPNMGFHTSPAIAFLMTVFNVRLGWWAPHPGLSFWQVESPPSSLYYLLMELFGFAGLKRSFVYLSDGGHFDNLGVYELIRRRTKLIVVCDGEQDSKLCFESLGGVIRKARTDFGVEVNVDPAQIADRDDGVFSASHCAVGTIEYPDDKGNNQPAFRGYLVYMKLSLTGDEDRDILQYKSAHEDFPHQTTGDQFFNESQFESYRRLGEHVAETTFRHFRIGGVNSEAALERSLGNLLDLWRASAKSSAAFTRNAEQLSRLWKSLQEDKDLGFLGFQVFPEWEHMVTTGVREGWLHSPVAPPEYWMPSDEDALRKAFFYFCQVIRLMENVYLDLDLESQSRHPDNAGWMNLFHLWSWSGVFRLTWAVTRLTYGARFVEFCGRELGLRDLVKMEIVDATESALNFREKEIYSELHKHFFREDGRSPHLKRILMRLENPRAENQRIELPCGFALLKDTSKLCPNGTRELRLQLFFLRIQDHLRERGLGRMALQHLTTKFSPLSYYEPPSRDYFGKKLELKGKL